MPVPKCNQRAVHKYTKNHYDRIDIQVYKGIKEKIKQHAEKMGESMNKFIWRAIDETIERDNERSE